MPKLRWPTLRWLAAITAGVLMLTGCAVSTPPVSAAERASIRKLLVSQQWAPLHLEYPEAIQPEIPVVHTVTDHDWAAHVVTCLRGRGYIAFLSANGFSYDAYTGETALEFRVEGYICTASFAKQSDVVGRLTTSQRAAFDSFQINQVQPCLRVAGAATSDPPSARLTGLAGWSPYDIVWADLPTPRALDYLEKRCPPIPQWLNLDN